MKHIKSISIGSKGFTLVEIIVTLVAAGILGVIFTQFMGTALDASWNAVEIVRDEAGGEGVMEEIIADYVEEMNSDPGFALGTLVTNNSNPIKKYGENVTMQYIEFDGAGNEKAPTSNDNLKVVVQASGPAAPAITGRYPLTIILTNSRREAGNQIVIY
ncbi:MAG: prepilin-type N-terminal cleavage/methylation domain-containing protein [Desulfobacterales bacterium]|nr:prepilin-type N-terminal cleavage/methylation domain-containing protein [Desulfobacterales bacterium]